MEFTWHNHNVKCIFSGTTLIIKGRLTFTNASEFLKNIPPAFDSHDGSYVTIDLSQLDEIDSAGITTVYYLSDKLKVQNIEVELLAGHENIKKKLQIFKPVAGSTKQAKAKKSFFEAVGEKAYYFYKNFLYSYLSLTAEIFYWSIADIFRPKARRKGEFFNQAVIIGVNAVWIVGVMSLIIGLVLALQSAAQLREFGANIYIVDLTVIAMMREMGPLITAILVAGRSGSAIAAEIATMKVTSEIDALTTMGLNPVRFVMVPKMYGSLVTMPFLTILADVMGIAGGMLVAFLYLDISPEVFIGRMGESLYNKDIMFGFVKSLVFAGIIVLTGCFYGFKVDKGAEGVGRVTTTSVVVSISLVIVADSIMGILFY